MKIMVSLSALAPSQYRKYVKGWDKGRYANAFEKAAGKKNAYRIYLPLDNEAESFVPAPQEIARTISELGWTVEDYRAGIAVDKSGKRRMRIGRLLTKHPHLLKLFNEDKTRAAYRGKFIICISRHPYDIAGASTDRGWTSCMNLVDGENRHYIADEIKIGSLIAYLIEEHDTNIKRPTARTMIKPFYKDDDKEQLHPLLIADPAVYGTNVKGFVRTVQRWLDKNLNHKRTEGIYRIHDSSYEDGYGAHLKTNEDPDHLRFKYDLRKDQNDYLTSIVSEDERRLAFRSYPQLMQLVDRMLLSDWRKGAVADPNTAFQIMLDHPDRIFDGHDATRSLFHDEHTRRAEIRYLLQSNPGFFRAAEDRLKFRDDELVDILVFNGEVIGPQIPESRWNSEIIRGLLQRLNNDKLAALTKHIPRSLIPADPIERVQTYPRMILFFKEPSLELVKAALDGSIKDDWKAIIYTLRTELLTRPIADYMISWLMTHQKPADVIRFGYGRLLSQNHSNSPVADDPVLIERCLAFGEKEGIDVSKSYTACAMLNLLSPEQRIERYKTGMYFNVLTTAFEEKSLNITAEECNVIIHQDEGVDFFRASLDILWELVVRAPKAFCTGIDYTVDHPHTDTILELPMCNIANPSLWSSIAVHPEYNEFGLYCMRRLLVASKLFGDTVTAYYVRSNPEYQKLYAEFRPDLPNYIKE